jgi:hypothetical protein
VIEQQAPPRRARFGRALITLIIIGLLAMWGYVVYLAFGPGRADSPDKLDDPTFAEAAERRCADALERIDARPVASEFAGRPDERAAEIEDSNADLAAMLTDLRALVPDGEDGRLVGLWLDDWVVFLRDREDYVDRLRGDDGARLLVTEKDGRHITLAIDDFAKVNHMTSCATPGDA